MLSGAGATVKEIAGKGLFADASRHFSMAYTHSVHASARNTICRFSNRAMPTRSPGAEQP